MKVVSGVNATGHLEFAKLAGISSLLDECFSDLGLKLSGFWYVSKM